MKPGIVQVHLIDLSEVPADGGACLSLEEVTRAGRFRFQGDSSRWIACRARLREILGQATGLPPGEVPLVFSKFGKPGLAPPYEALHFNLSHAAERGLIALCGDGPVGVDLEALNRAADLVDCENSFCHPAEIASLPANRTERGHELLRIWTAKEAVLKALGTGLSYPPEAVRIVFEPAPGHAESEKILSGVENQRLHFLAHSRLVGYQAWVSAPPSVIGIGYF